ncbi:hypothetical protein EXIGLDRAFT_770468 [Exidia glandulosa HHB12029]|uniref:HhH-GPD domain-containing protein n=1 Tax=Exidia glandulosa HHB12029 TaxID=1314781 RepID=A0A165GP37_EXIGL|nr:hypothetical protein EXIGLDRAFT_770468 [Exidia glandulosa HHB12029]
MITPSLKRKRDAFEHDSGHLAPSLPPAPFELPPADAAFMKWLEGAKRYLFGVDNEDIDLYRARIPARRTPAPTTQTELDGDSEYSKSKRFGILISYILASSNRSGVAFAAVASLRTALNGLTLEKVLTADDSVITAALSPFGFWSGKTQHIRVAAQKLKDDFGGDVPKTVEELRALPGIAYKMAMPCLRRVWKLEGGNGVGLHFHSSPNTVSRHIDNSRGDETRSTILALQRAGRHQSHARMRETDHASVRSNEPLPPRTQRDKASPEFVGTSTPIQGQLDARRRPRSR